MVSVVKEEEFDPAELEMNSIVFFLNSEDMPLEFIVDHRDQAEGEKLCRLIDKHLGIATCDFSKFGPHSIVLVQDTVCTWKHQHDIVFKLSYIEKCIQAGRILNITDFTKCKTTKYTSNLNYMDIVYFNKFTWNNVPVQFIIPTVVSSSSDSEDEKVVVFKKRSRSPTKNTRLPYNFNEKEAIVKYIVRYGEYSRIKGKALWIEMEDNDVCPKRTWQSMKEHFIKVILRQLNAFKFLTDNQKKSLASTNDKK